MATFPTLHFNSRVYECPFDKNEKIETHRKRSGSNLTMSPSQRSIIKDTSTKSGYCELCDSNYKNRSQHLKGKLHRATINSTDFKNLDKMISSGTDFQTFLNKLITKKKTKLKDISKTINAPRKVCSTKLEERIQSQVKFR